LEITTTIIIRSVDCILYTADGHLNARRNCLRLCVAPLRLSPPCLSRKSHDEGETTHRRQRKCYSSCHVL